MFGELDSLVDVVCDEGGDEFVGVGGGGVGEGGLVDEGEDVGEVGGGGDEGEEEGDEGGGGEELELGLGGELGHVGEDFEGEEFGREGERGGEEGEEGGDVVVEGEGRGQRVVGVLVLQNVLVVFHEIVFD